MFSTIAQKKGVPIVEDLPAESFLVVGDPGRLAQVITNLISNAIKFTQSGSITVQLRSLGTPPGNHGSLSFKVAVRDTGRGLQSEKRSPYYSSGSRSHPRHPLEGMVAQGWGCILVSTLWN